MSRRIVRSLRYTIATIAIRILERFRYDRSDRRAQCERTIKQKCHLLPERDRLYTLTLGKI